ncbi:MAG: isopenicillin N synthase family oxygenase [Actinomycetota bacterium]|nr:isopenicillin N synthase family oxygenase [Actinomycetota bacterium]
MAELPVIDLSPFYEGGSDGRRSVAREIDRACRELGFFGVVGHRVPPDLVAETRSIVREFFELPIQAKLEVRTPDRRSGRGYVPVEGEALSATTRFTAPPDLKESFSMGPPDPGDDPYVRFEPSGVAFSPNVWPDRLPRFEPTMSRLYHALGSLADDLLVLTTLAFGLPPDWFVARNDRPTSALRVLRYPPGTHLGEGQFPASPHTDYGTWTILHKRPGRTGLEVQALDGSWTEVHAPEGGFVVNVGDLLMRWTGGHWLSTLHRVTPVDSSDPRGEVSLAFFHQPNWDVMVYPWTTDVVERPERAERYDPGSPERHYRGMSVADLVFGKYRASVSVAGEG